MNKSSSKCSEKFSVLETQTGGEMAADYFMKYCPGHNDCSQSSVDEEETDAS